MRLKNYQCLNDYSQTIEGIYSDQVFSYYEFSVNAKNTSKEAFDSVDEYLSENGGVVYEGFGEMLRKLYDAGFDLYVVSNCQAGYIELMLEKTGFGRYIKDHVCFGDNGLFKAENINLICERNEIKKPIYVGDTQMDADACIKAGVPIVFASYGFGRVADPDYVIGKPADLVGLFV